jgi:hypothetical protein
MGEETADRHSGSSGCAWGCLAAFCLGLALLVLGWDRFGTLCIILVFALTLGEALRSGGFRVPFSDRRLTRGDNPLVLEPRRGWWRDDAHWPVDADRGNPPGGGLMNPRNLILLSVATALIAAAGFLAGWTARERRAAADCREMGGKWSQAAGYCYGHPYGEAQE